MRYVCKIIGKTIEAHHTILFKLDKMLIRHRFASWFSPAFNPTTGIFTVPTTGRYSFEATINYSTAAAISVTLGAGINPSFAIRQNATTNLISGLFPVLNVNVALVLTLRAVLGNGTITLAGEVDLNAGDTIDLFYEANGLTISLTLGGANSGGIVWSCHRIS